MVFVYIQPSQRNSILLCALQREIAKKKLLKPLFCGFKIIQIHSSEMLVMISSMFMPIYTVSQKNITDIFDCNLKTNYQILIIFGTSIPDTTCHQMTI